MANNDYIALRVKNDAHMAIKEYAYQNRVNISEAILMVVPADIIELSKVQAAKVAAKKALAEAQGK